MTTRILMVIALLNCRYKYGNNVLEDLLYSITWINIFQAVIRYGYMRMNIASCCWKLGAHTESAVSTGGIPNSRPVVPGAPKSLPGVREQLLSHRVGDTCKTSFYTRWHTKCILFKDDECEI